MSTDKKKIEKEEREIIFQQMRKYGVVELNHRGIHVRLSENVVMHDIAKEEPQVVLKKKQKVKAEPDFYNVNTWEENR